MVKRVICILIAFCLISGIVAFAENDFTITPDGEFTVYRIGEEKKAVAKIMGMSEDDFESVCEQKGIIYFAVNSSNSKQIQITCNQTGFSNSVVNLSDLSDEKIRILMSDLTGTESINGEIVTKNSQKFIKTQIASSDSGGEYTVVEYITVAGKLNYTLSFFTEKQGGTDYIEKTFESYNTKDFYEESSSTGVIKYVIPVAMLILIIASVMIIITLVRDIRNTEKTSQNDIRENDDQDKNEETEN